MREYRSAAGRRVASAAVVLGAMLGLARSLGANEIDYVETFALAPDRAEALKELIPGTEEYYYYHCLHYQHTGRFDDVETVLKQWIARYKQTSRVEEIRNRQALLLYKQDPQRALKLIRDRLGLTFSHQKIPLEKKIDLPTSLDPRTISHAALSARAFADRQDLGGFEDAALDRLVRTKLNPDQRRHLLGRLRRPDYADLPVLVVDDLKYQYSGGFGSHPVHAQLLPEQLEECLRLLPELIQNTSFITAYLAKLRPGNDVDWTRDPRELEAYLARLDAFVQRLPPVQNSLKAHVLYQRLEQDRKNGTYDAALFKRYIELPRQVSYINREYVQRRDFRDQMANLAEAFQVTQLPPVGSDEELVRDYLMHLLVDAADFKAYADYIEHNYLEDLFAETKMVNGVGDMEQWFSLLSPDQVRRLKERVDLAILPTNAEFIDADDAVALAVAVKNVEKLIVKTFEINTEHYYRMRQEEITTAIDLDGLVAHSEQAFEYRQAPLQRHVERFAFPHIAKPGIYVIELIGNGISSRALIRKGRLVFAERTGAAGHVFTVYDEKGGKVADARLWLAGHEYAAEADGTIAVPFSTSPGRQKVVIARGDFAILGEFDHRAEQYALAAGVHVEREALVGGETCRLIVRPELTVTGVRADIGLLEEVALTLSAVDEEGIASTVEAPDFKLYNDRESVHEFRTPAALRSVTVTLRAKVRSMSENKKIDLAVQTAAAVNGIDASEKTEYVYFRKTPDGYRVELLGRSGEARADRAVHLVLKHRDFTRPVDVTLKTDAKGQVGLGVLEGIVTVNARGPEDVSATWSLPEDRCSHEGVLHAVVGEPIRVAYMGRDDLPLDERVSLLEQRGGSFVTDCRPRVRFADGFLTIDDLPAGDYSLFIKPENREIAIRIAAGMSETDRILGRHRMLERCPLQPLQIGDIRVGDAAVTLTVRHATASTRVHVAVTRFVPDATVFDQVGYPSIPSPVESRPARPRSLYLSGRNIGDEYRYILERGYAAKYPGNMLTRPSLLLNPWSLRKTSTGSEQAAAGEAWDTVPEEARMSGIYGERGSGARGEALARGGEGGLTPNLDFLPSASVVLANLAPDKDGRIELPRARLGGGQQLHLMAVDGDGAVYRTLALPETHETWRDIRMARILDPDRHFTEQRKIDVAPAGRPVVVDDIRAAKLEVYDSLAKVYTLYATLSGDATLTEFGFILTWPDLADDQKREFYSRHACHELNFFLARKDPAFFKAVIAPYLVNKKDRTFLDDWLLGNPLDAYLSPWAYQRLNMVERVLLGQRIRGEAVHTARHVKDRFDLVPPDAERFDRLFLTALRTGAMAPGELDDRIEEMRKEGMKAGNDRGFSATFPAARQAPASDMAAVAAEVGGVAEAEVAALDSVTPAAPPPVMTKALRERKEVAKSDGRLVGDATRRSRLRAFYRRVDTTEEWVENNYHKLPIERQVATLVPVNAFWKDYAAYDGKGPFLSANLAEASGSFTETMLALAVLDLPFKAGEHKTAFDQARLTLTPAGDAVVYRKEVSEAQAGEKAQVVLVSQNFFARDDRYRHEDNERFDKFVTDEFQTARVYGCQVVLTNPTSTRRKVDVLLQVPEGAVPVLNGFFTRSLHRQLDPYSTQALEYYFYFPAAGDWRHYPVHVAQAEASIAFAAPFVFTVKDKLSLLDTAAWAYVSQHGSDEQVLDYLRRNNVDRIDLNLIAFRMRDKAMFGTTLGLLRERHVYHDTLWSYGVHHDDVPAMREYLPHTMLAGGCGVTIDSPLLTVDPVARHAYQHKEYWPLVNARVYQLGKVRKILNQEFHGQYRQFLDMLAYKPALDDDDRMALIVYLLLQDRVAEAMNAMTAVEAKRLHTDIQYDYLRAYLAFYREDPKAARKAAEPYREHPVKRWRHLFGDVLAQCDEIDGKTAGKVVDDENRDQVQAGLAATAPALDATLEDRVLVVRHGNLERCTVRFYLMNLELLFSKQPFVQDVGGQFAAIRPNRVVEMRLDAAQAVDRLPLPEDLRERNLMIEVSGSGVTRMQAYYPNTLAVQLLENYGQVRVTHAGDGRVLSKVYVKVYARMKNGAVRFYKDGYTDLRGRFDYASLSTDELEQTDRFAILVMSEAFGALVKEAAPPKR